MVYLLPAIATYLALGAVFAVAFVWRGIARIDPAARHASLPVRLILFPGSAALWPILLFKWVRMTRRQRSIHAAIWAVLTPLLLAAIAAAVIARPETPSRSQAMSVGYRVVQWNHHKRVYDGLIALSVVAFVVVFAVAGRVIAPDVSAPIMAMRGLAIVAFVLLHVILCIGPLARLDARFAPLLYNRRHLGVTFFLAALAHALIAVGFYGGFGVRNPVVALVDYPLARGQLPFELLGMIALLIFFVMAATSHDFWLKNLSPRIWKSLHMAVYGAYALVVLHVAFGVMQAERHPAIPTLLAAAVLAVGGLHVIAGLRESKKDRAPVATAADGWIDAASVDEIPESRAKVVCIPGKERVAIFRVGDSFSAVANACAHQGGPIGEGRVVDGCLTCPWHGYQYVPHNGQSPPPFTEKISTYQLRINGTRILLNPDALPPGTPVPPCQRPTAESP